MNNNPIVNIQPLQHTVPADGSDPSPLCISLEQVYGVQPVRLSQAGRPASGIPQNSNMATLRSQMQKNYYVSMFDPRSNIPGDGVHYRLVGPFTTLDEATPHVDRTRTVARELDFRADFCSFGVLATEATKPGVLNSKILA